MQLKGDECGLLVEILAESCFPSMSAAGQLEGEGKDWMAVVSQWNALATVSPAESKILVVDDEPLIADLIEASLKQEGYVVSLAVTGRQGLDMVKKSQPHLILLDVMLPDIDGMSFCEALRNNTATSAIPVIMLSALDTTAHKVAGFNHGADDYLAKPFHVPELLARVRTQLQRKRREDSLASEVEHLRAIAATSTQKPNTDGVKRIRVFVASPGDVLDEREIVWTVIDGLNRTIGAERNLTLELVRWETHITPDAGRPQEVINQQVGTYDIFIGIMWKRLGTPTGVAPSGTVEEFEQAFESWKQTGLPRIMFYFNQASYTLGTPEEAEQVNQVLRFRRQLQGELIFCDYKTSLDFERFVREHLTKAINDLLREVRPE